MLRLVAAISVLAIGASAQADSTAPGPAPVSAAPPAPGLACKQPEYHQFDFWVGEWSVTEHDQPAGKSRIEAILQNCAIAEHWSGAQGSNGKSYNAYDPDLKQWQQFWVAESGTTLLLRGGLQGKAMVLEGDHHVAGAPRRERITWTPNADGSVRQLWEQSSDGGKSWTVAFDGLYRHPR